MNEGNRNVADVMLKRSYVKEIVIHSIVTHLKKANKCMANYSFKYLASTRKGLII